MRHNTPGSITGNLKTVLRIEGLCVLIISTLLYQSTGQGWGTFALLFFIPDISLLGYLQNKHYGAILYNLAHSYILPLLMLIVMLWSSNHQWLYLLYIWIGHIGFDRMLGFGLKYSDGFKYTHLGVVGKG